MEDTKVSNYKIKNSLSSNSGNKSKILYKIKISENSLNNKKFMGQCFLVNINSLPEKNIQHSRHIRKLGKLPSILIKDSSKIMEGFKDKIFKKRGYSNEKY